MEQADERAAGSNGGQTGVDAIVLSELVDGLSPEQIGAMNEIFLSHGSDAGMKSLVCRNVLAI